MLRYGTCGATDDCYICHIYHLMPDIPLYGHISHPLNIMIITMVGGHEMRSSGGEIRSKTGDLGSKMTDLGSEMTRFT